MLDSGSANLFATCLKCMGFLASIVVTFSLLISLLVQSSAALEHNPVVLLPGTFRCVSGSCLGLELFALNKSDVCHLSVDRPGWFGPGSQIESDRRS